MKFADVVLEGTAETEGRGKNEVDKTIIEYMMRAGSISISKSYVSLKTRYTRSADLVLDWPKSSSGTLRTHISKPWKCYRHYWLLCRATYLYIATGSACSISRIC